MKDNSNEMIDKAKNCQSPEELIALAKENGAELTSEQAESYFKCMHENGELSDDELNNVTGGGCYNHDGYLYTTIGYGCEHYEERGDFGVAGTCCRCKYWDYSKVSQVVIIGQPLLCQCEANRRKQEG